MEATSVEVLINENWVQIVSCYISPCSPISFNHTTSFSRFTNNNFCLIGGDFNGRDTSWGDPSCNSLGVWLNNFANNFDFTICHPESPTSFGSAAGTFIDKFLSKNVLSENLVKTNASFSDHLSIETYSQFHSSNTNGKFLLHSVKVFSWTRVHKLNKFLLDKFANLYLPIDCNMSVQELDDVCGEIENIFKMAIDKFVPVRQINFAKITLAHDTKCVRTELRKLLRKYNRNKFLPTVITNVIRNDIRVLTSKSLELIKRDITNHYGNILVEINDIYSFYHSVGCRKRSSKFANISVLSDDNGNTVNNCNDICKMFAQHFANNHNLTINHQSSRDSVVKTCLQRLLQNGSQTIQITADSPALPATNMNANNIHNFNSLFVTPSKIAEVIAARNNKPSAGIDTMPNCIIKLFNVKLFDYVSVLFNQILAAGHFPSCWKHATVVAIPKVGKPISNVNNWRPISLLNSLSKIFERIVAQRIYSFNSENEVIPHHQFGFQSAHSTCHPLAILQNQVNEGLNNGLITTVVSLDIRAAFDTVWHDGLIYKLVKLKFPKYLIFIINSFLRNRTFRIKFSNILSDKFNIPAGVPQGSVLGPILFNISMYDIPKSSNFRLLQYADDTAIAISYPRIYRIEKNINTYLECLSKWYDSWKFQLNASKTELIHFVGTQNNVSWLRRKRLRKMIIKLNGVVIQPKDNIRYLGVYFSRNNRFTVHVEKLYKKLWLPRLNWVH